MKPLSRRDAIKGGTVLAVTVATLGFPAKADNRDAELLALERELVRTIDAWNAAGDMPDEKFDQWGAYTRALESRIAEMPVKTAEGVAVKLRRLRHEFDDDGSIWAKEINELIETSIAGLEEMGGAL